MLQSQKLRDVFNMDFPDNSFLLKTLTVVSGPDMVDLTFHNFVSYKENVGKVCQGTPGLDLGPWDSLDFLRDTGLGGGAQEPDCCSLWSCRSGLRTYWP